MKNNKDVNIDALFDYANYLISRLPSYSDQISFHDVADTRTLQARSVWKSVAEKLIEISNIAPKEKKGIFEYWAADTFIGLNELKKALQITPKPLPGSRSSLQTSQILSLKLATNEQITGNDITTLFGAKLTAFGKKNIISIIKFLDIKLLQLQKQDTRNLLQEWIFDAYKYPTGMPLFNGHASYFIVRQPTLYAFDHSSIAENMCTKLMREAENVFREEQGLPYVGEGWIAETALFYEIKKAFPTETVIQHGRPEWLGRQHLDVYLPDRGIALEYQGEQHDKLIAFFGGEEAYLKNLKRDKMKFMKCKKNNVRIIYVRQGYSLSTILTDIVTVKH